LNFYPCQYNPAENKLYYYPDINVEIEYTDNGENEIQYQRETISEAFKPLYEAFSVGPEGDEIDTPVERGAYLIISTPTFYSGIQELAEWKRRMGYYTYVASTSETGTSSYSIKNYIINAYETWDVPPEYVLLVGDTNNGMPTFFVSGYSYNCCTDLPYVLVDDIDYFPEMLIGRFPITSTTQLGTILNKIFHYEKEPYLNEVDWYNRALMIGDYSGATSVKFTKEFCEDQLEYGGYTDVVNAYFPGSSTALLSQTINNGASFVNYRGYGGYTYWTLNTWTQWGSNNVNSLNNGYQLPIVTSIVCGGGRFDYSGECLGETWLRTGSPTYGKGAVAFCGPSELHTHTKWNNNIDCGIYWGIFRENINTFGAALLRGKMELWLDYPHNRVGIGSSTNSVGFYFHVYNILGDPGLRMWTAQPAPIDADYDNTIALGMNQFSITLHDNIGNPLENAYVCLRKGEELYEGGFTDESGMINLPLNNYTPGQMMLTVTGKNLIPLLDDIDVTEESVVLGIDEITIIDDNSGSTSGNNDGMASPAENVDLNIMIKNYGNSVTASEITATLTTDCSLINIVQGNANVDNLAPGAQGEAGFSISLDSDYTTAVDPELTLQILSNQGDWQQTVWLEISDAEFVPVEYEYSPTMLEPGSDADLIISINNAGECDATSVSAQLISLDPLIQVTGATGNWGNVLSGETISNSSLPFHITAADEVIPGRLVHLQLNFNTFEGYTPTSDIIISVGTVNQSDPMGPDGYGYYCFDSFDLEYEQAPTYDWVTFTGTQLNLPDYGDEEDCMVMVNLPFTFQYYGDDYNQISVCSNGFIAMGGSDIVQFRNKAIPSAIGPPAMIAGFWDDLKMISGGAVYKYEDSANNRFIIEYRNVKNDYGNANERFQIILYDPAHYPTPTGDGVIVFQYQDVNDWDSSDNFSTVGITDYNHTTGLEYVFSNIYPQASHQLADGLAIKFTTDPGFTVMPSLALTFEPVNPPIEIPIGGGSFEFSVVAENIGSDPAAFDFWTEAVLPNGNTVSPLFLRNGLNLAPGASIMRNLMQNVPPQAPAGQYIYRGILGVYPGTIYNSEEFNFSKETSSEREISGQ
jgi:hypothetical protein